ncbi:type I restriction enzyme HsdR N-terminal domain-containing protein [uncultured Mesonia sp.]|uniref:type I restriction enzyme HsdR N-terminal domain-containing protein n=1 Tax=uncultured Mesonia sp. TaxID=399731 RepID=UPI00374EC0E8
MTALNFPTYSFRFKNKQNKTAIFDSIRKKFIILTPEEWVRQHVVHYLHYEKNYPWSMINVEKQVLVNQLPKRYDVVGFKTTGDLQLIVECKAPKVKITQETFDQIARYNLSLKADFLMVTNGLSHYFCKMDYNKQQYNFLPELPLYK